MRIIFDIERLIGKMVADGKTPVPGRTNVLAGTILYKVLWEGYPPDIATWEEADNRSMTTTSISLRRHWRVRKWTRTQMTRIRLPLRTYSTQ